MGVPQSRGSQSQSDMNGNGSVESNTKYGEWRDGIDCSCDLKHRKVIAIRIVRTPLLSTAGDVSFSALRLTANVVTVGHVEKWLGTHNIPLEHQAVECDVCCNHCNHKSHYTFEYLGGIGKLVRVGCYTKKYSAHYKERQIKNTTLFLSDVYETYDSVPGRWTASHYDAVKNNCQMFAHLFWSQLFGLKEDDHAEWQSQTQIKCKCKPDRISVRRMRFVRVQKHRDVEEISSSVIDSTVHLLSMGVVDPQRLKSDSKSVLHAIEFQCLCNDCATMVHYTVENSKRGKYFRCGLYGKQMRPLREVQKRKSLNLKQVHKLYKMSQAKHQDNKQWACTFWNRLLDARVIQSLTTMSSPSVSSKSSSPSSDTVSSRPSSSKLRLPAPPVPPIPMV